MKRERVERGDEPKTTVKSGAAKDSDFLNLHPPLHMRRDVFDALAAEDAMKTCLLEYLGAFIVTDDHLRRRPRKPMYVYQYEVDDLLSQGLETIDSDLIDMMKAKGALAIIGSAVPDSKIGVGLKTCNRCMRKIPIDANFCCYCSKECFD